MFTQFVRSVAQFNRQKVKELSSNVKHTEMKN